MTLLHTESEERALRIAKTIVAIWLVGLVAFLIWLICVDSAHAEPGPTPPPANAPGYNSPYAAEYIQCYARARLQIREYNDCVTGLNVVRLWLGEGPLAYWPQIAGMPNPNAFVSLQAVEDHAAACKATVAFVESHIYACLLTMRNTSAMIRD